MADSVDRVFGHALNTVNKIRPGSQKPPSTDRLTLYGLYKQSMEGDVLAIADRPSPTNQPSTTTAEQLRKEQEKWDAWRANQGLSRTEAKRRYIEKLIATMHKYASQTDEARQLVEELEFVWDQIKSNSQHSGSSEHSSPLQNLERSGYVQSERSGDVQAMVSSSAAALENATGAGADRPLRILSPVSQADEEEALQEEQEEEEFVDAPVSQVDPADLNMPEDGEEGGTQDPRAPLGESPFNRRVQAAAGGDARWRKRVENGLFKLTTEVAALREQLENHRFVKNQRRKSFFNWVLRLGWWVVSFVLADAALLWIVILYMRKKQDRRLEGAVRVLLGDAVAQVQRVASDVKMPALPTIKGLKGKKSG